MELNAKHEKFARLYAEGATAAAAYREVCGDKGGARNSGYRWLQREDVKKRIEELEDETRDMLNLSKEELLDKLYEAIITPVGEIDEFHPLCEEVTYNRDGSKKIKMISKLGAIEKIARMAGYNEPDEVEVKGDALASLIATIRKKKDNDE